MMTAFHSLKDLYTQLANHPEFAKVFRQDPEQALKQYGIILSPQDLDLVLKRENPLAKDQTLEKRESK